MSEIPDRSGGLGSTFKRLIRRLTWPSNAVSGQSRIVAGADTPPELASYGILQALLFYVTDKDSPFPELGYFFIGQSNVLDLGGDEKVLLFGHVKYPIAGDPSSATPAQVRTHHQISMANGAFVPFTRFKDQAILVDSTVPEIQFGNSGNIFFLNTATLFLGLGDGSDPGTLFVTLNSLLEISSGGRLNIPVGGIFDIDGESAPRGIVDFVGTAANSAAIGAEAVVLTGNSITWRAGRAYEAIMHDPAVTGSAVGVAVIRTIRRNNVAGALKANQLAHDLNNTVAGISTSLTDRVIIRNNTGSNIVDNIVVTFTASAGTVVANAAADRIRYLEVRDVGLASRYPNAVQI